MPDTIGIPLAAVMLLAAGAVALAIIVGVLNFKDWLVDRLIERYKGRKAKKQACPARRHLP
jgi:hypothetical protein